MRIILIRSIRLLKALIITDTSLSEDQTDLEPVEHFISSFRVLEPQNALDITTNLANQSLVHALTCKDIDSTATTTDSDPFIYTTTSQYTADTFNSIIIDTGTSKKSTAGYS